MRNTEISSFFSFLTFRYQKKIFKLIFKKMIPEWKKSRFNFPEA